MIAIKILTGALIVLGIAGAAIPLLPGTIFVWLGAFVYAVATEFDPVGPGRLVFLGALVGLAYLVDYVAGAFGVDRLGGSRWAVAGALVGALVGLFFGLPGLILGPFAGAVLLELGHSRRVATSLKSGMGTVVGALIGTAVKLALAVIMAGLFLWWTWLSPAA